MICTKFWKQVNSNVARSFCIESTQLLFLLKKKFIVNHNASKIIATLIENSESQKNLGEGKKYHREEWGGGGGEKYLR